MNPEEGAIVSNLLQLCPSYYTSVTVMAQLLVVSNSTQAVVWNLLREERPCKGGNALSLLY